MIERYEINEINQWFSNQKKYESWWLVEFYYLEALIKNKIVQTSLVDWTQYFDKVKINLDEISKIEQETKHDVIAFIKSISNQIGSFDKWIHFGITSTDVVDTGFAYQIKNVNKIIENDLTNLISTIKMFAKKYKYTYIIGRTHGIHAEITTFGYKFANYFDEFLRIKNQFNLSKQNIETGKISGAVGNYANLSPNLQDYVCKKLNLNSSLVSTQVLGRDIHASYIYSLVLIAKECEKIAIELRHLQRTEIGEIEEKFDKNQKGSSAMPHKKNPISAENITGLSRLIKGYLDPSLENILLWHERDISHSSAERIIFPDICNLISYILRRLNNILLNLEIKKEKMIENINLTNGLVFSQQIMLEIINLKKWKRLDAYNYVQEMTNKAYNSKIHLQQLLIEDSNCPLSKEEISNLFKFERYLKNIDLVYKRLKIEV